MKIKLGIAPIAWSNDDMPELGGDTPIEQCLEEASQLVLQVLSLVENFQEILVLQIFYLINIILKCQVVGMDLC